MVLHEKLGQEVGHSDHDEKDVEASRGPAQFTATSQGLQMDSWGEDKHQSQTTCRPRVPTRTNTHTLGNYSNYNTYNFVFHYLQVGLEKWESVKSFSFVCLEYDYLKQLPLIGKFFSFFFLCNIAAHTHTWSEIFFGGKINKQTKSLFFKLISSWKSLYQFICILLDSICPYSCRFFFQLTIDL